MWHSSRCEDKGSGKSVGSRGMECDEELPSRETEALAALRASPLVKEVGFNTGAKQGVYARLWCARECHPQRYSEQLNITKTRKTLAECAEELLDLVNQKHGDHLEAAERELTRCETEAAIAAGPSAPSNALEAMIAAQRVQPAADLAAAAERAAADAHRAEMAAAQQLEVAAKAAEAARQEADRLQEPRVAHSGHPHGPCSL